LVVGDCGHQAQHRQPNQETVGRCTNATAKGYVQCLALRFRKFIEVIQQRCGQLLQSGEGELHVGLHAGELDTADP